MRRCLRRFGVLFRARLQLEYVSFWIGHVDPSQPLTGRVGKSDHLADRLPSGLEYGFAGGRNIVHDECYVNKARPADCNARPVLQVVVVENLQGWSIGAVTRQAQVLAAQFCSGNACSSLKISPFEVALRGHRSQTTSRQSFQSPFATNDVLVVPLNSLRFL